MSITRNTYRLFNRTKMIVKYATCGLVIGAAGGEILARTDTTTPSDPIDFNCLNRTLKPTPYAFAQGDIAGAIAGILLLGIVNLGLISICQATESITNSSRTNPQLFLRVASSLTGAGIGILKGYYKEIPELGDIPIPIEQSPSYSSRLRKR